MSNAIQKYRYTTESRRKHIQTVVMIQWMLGEYGSVWRCLTPDCRSMSLCVRIILNTAWDLLLSSFMFVAATVRDLFPSDIKDSMSCQRGKNKTKHAPCKSWNNLVYLGSIWWMQNSRNQWRLLRVLVFFFLPCSWPQPGVTGHQRMAQRHCALSLSGLVGSYREDEKLLILCPSKTNIPIFSFIQSVTPCFKVN